MSAIGLSGHSNRAVECPFSGVKAVISIAPRTDKELCIKEEVAWKVRAVGLEPLWRWLCLSPAASELQAPKMFAFRWAKSMVMGVGMVGVVITGEALTPTTEGAG